MAKAAGEPCQLATVIGIVQASGAMEPIPIHGLTSAEVVEAGRGRLGVGAAVVRRLYRQAVREGRFDPGGLGVSSRTTGAMRSTFSFALPRVVRQVEEPGGMGETVKLVLGLEDGYEIECVRIPMGRGRYTLCVSSQVGCKMGCAFCETARMGLIRHLTAAEIVAQLLVARHVMGWSIRNVVFMGMGEALDNPEGLFGALRVLTDPGGIAMAQERITVCTVGRVDGIRRLAEQGWKRLNLSVSLNAADDATRSRLMPVNRTAPLAELTAALADYRPRRNFALGVNYCLMPGINDGHEDARRVAALCAPLGRVMLNLIPYNPGNEPLTRAPSEPEIARFVEWLREEGLPVRRRVTKGRDVMAACGQLGNAELREVHRTRRRLASEDRLRCYGKQSGPSGRRARGRVEGPRG